MKIGDMQKLNGSGSGENDDSKIRYYCKTKELFDVLEKGTCQHWAQRDKS